MNLDVLPVLYCPFGKFGEISADPNAEGWSQIAGVSFRDVVTGAAPQQGTTAKAGWDGVDLRFLFCAEDTHPWATLTQRDAPLYQEETVEVFLDAVGDLQSYFEFEVNPLNAVLDLVVRRTRRGLVKNFAWRCEGLRTAVQKTETGWNAELAIPLGSVAAQTPLAGERWRVNFCRIDRPQGEARELTAWSPTGHPQFHMAERFGTLEFGAKT